MSDTGTKLPRGPHAADWDLIQRIKDGARGDDLKRLVALADNLLHREEAREQSEGLALCRCGHQKSSHLPASTDCIYTQGGCPCTGFAPTVQAKASIEITDGSKHWASDGLRKKCQWHQQLQLPENACGRCLECRAAEALDRMLSKLQAILEISRSA